MPDFSHYRLSPTALFAILSLVILLLLGSGLALALSEQFEQQIARTVADTIGHEVATMIRSQLSVENLKGPLTGDQFEAFDTFLRRNVHSNQVARVKVWNLDGLIIYSDDPALVGRVFPVEDALWEAYKSQDVVAELASLNKPENVDEQSFGQLLEIYVPLVPYDSNQILGAYEVYLYYDGIGGAIKQTQVWVWGATGLALAGLWASLFWVFRRASHAIAEQRRLASTDYLTGLFNRRYLLEQMDLERERLMRYNIPSSLILLDIDFFKQYNDQHGHLAGDAALRVVAQCLRECTRHLDIAARYGGEEFVVVLPAADLESAAAVAERVRSLVAVTPFPYGALTVSLGVTSFEKQAPNNQQILTAADAALYRAKNQGRNRVCVNVPLEGAAGSIQSPSA